MTPAIIKNCETCDWKRDTTYIKGCCCDPDNDCSGEPDCSHWRKKQLTPAEEESYVRERWVDCVFGIKIYCGIVGRPSSCFPFNSWHAAYLFTKRREAEIADVEEEIGFLGGPYCLECPSVERILAREQAALAGLKRGWKGPNE